MKMTVSKKSTFSWVVLTSLALLVAPVLGSGLHGKSSSNINSNADDKLIAATSSVPANSSGFAMKLFTQVTNDSIKTDSKTNVVVSPFSAFAALSMTLNGAAGSTREQMAKVLGTTPDGVDALNRKNQATFASLAKNDGECM